MKLLSIAIPCYNSEAYMEKCIESLLTGGEEVEILVVDDGSSDRTAEIADSYAEKYPTIVKAIHQENGGHGEAVNSGIRNATGLYFKVVDSDDWVNQEAYVQILKTLEEFCLRKTGGHPQKSHAVPSLSPDKRSIRMGQCTYAKRQISSDAFYDLPYRTSS